MVDLGTLTWLLASQGFMQSSGIATIAKHPATSSSLANIICSDFNRATGYSIYNGGNGIGLHSNGEIRVRFDNMPTDTTAFKTAMNGVQLVYELATSVEVPVTPTQISSLKSLTTMYADTGNISVDYAADLKTYILNAISNAL